MQIKGINFNWPFPIPGARNKKVKTTVLPTGVKVERRIIDGVENIEVTSPRTEEPINMDVVRNMHVIDPIYVHPTRPSFFISEESVKTRGSWKNG